MSDEHSRKIANLRDPWTKETLEQAHDKIQSGNFTGAAEDIVYLVREFENRAPGAFSPMEINRSSLYHGPEMLKENDFPPPLSQVSNPGALPKYLEALAREVQEARSVADRALFLSLLDPIGAAQYYAIARIVKVIFNPRDGSWSFKAEPHGEIESQLIEMAFTFAANAAVRMDDFGFVNMRPVTDRVAPKGEAI